MKRRIGLRLAIIGLWISLSANAEEVKRLSPITVTATRIEVPLAQVPATLTVLGGEEIRARQPQDLGQILAESSGLSVVNRGTLGSQATVSIRGSEGGQVLVLLNGMRLNSAQSGDFNLSDLPVALNDIERIEIVRGPASALYGSDALAGVVHIITRRPLRKLQGNATVIGSRHRTTGASLAVSGARGPVDFRVGASGDYSDGYRENSQLASGRFDGLVAWAFGERHRFEVGTNFLQKRSGAPGGRSFPQAEDTQHDQNLRLFSQLQNEFTGSRLSTRVGYARWKNRFEDPNASPAAKVSRHTLHTIDLETQWEKTMGVHRVVFGGDGFADALDSTDNGQKDQTRGSVFGLYQVRPLLGLDVNLALRWDGHSDFSTRWNPRLLMAYRWFDGGRIRASVGQAYKAPSLNDRYWPDDGFTAGNPQLRPEVAWEYELGGDALWGDKGQLSAAVFQRDVRDLIAWAPDSAGKWLPSNVGKARIRGVEAEVKWRPLEWLSWAANYTYLQPKNRQDGHELIDRARHEGYMMAEFRVWRPLFLQASGRYFDLVPDANRLKNRFAVLDAGLRWSGGEGTSTRWQIAGKVTNLLNESYELTTGYPMPPIALQITLSAEF